MRSKLKNYLHLHFTVFIWGFTAVLGKLISLETLPLGWYRMLMAAVLIMLFLAVKNRSLKVKKEMLLALIITEVVITLHWVTFFMAIKETNISVALAIMLSGAFLRRLLNLLVQKESHLV